MAWIEDAVFELVCPVCGDVPRLNDIRMHWGDNPRPRNATGESTLETPSIVVQYICQCPSWSRRSFVHSHYEPSRDAIVRNKPMGELMYAKTRKG